MQISERLRAVSGMITPGCRLADVGTDHGYIPIELVLSEKIPSAIAMDVNRGPLERARAHIIQYGLEDRISTRLSDGLEKLMPGEADSVLIAGMGGMLTVRILKNGRNVLREVKELVLQPQSDIREVRRFLKTEGFVIADEDMVEEDGKFYPMLRAVPAEESLRGTAFAVGCQSDGGGKGEDVTELQLLYGPRLLCRKHPVLLRYLRHESRLLARVREKLEHETGEAARQRLQEVLHSLELNAEAQKICEG